MISQSKNTFLCLLGTKEGKYIISKSGRYFINNYKSLPDGYGYHLLIKKNFNYNLIKSILL